MGQSPLGKYAQVVAAATAVGVIATWLLIAVTAGENTTTLDRLTPFATLALGIVFGGAAAVNGYKAPLTAAHSRLDRVQAAVETTAAKALRPADAASVVAILAQSTDADQRATEPA